MSHTPIVEDPSVIAYRLGQVEIRVDRIEAKLDRFIEQFPTKEDLEKAVAPLAKEIESLRNRQFQVRLVIGTGVASPVLAFILTRI